MPQGNDDPMARSCPDLDFGGEGPLRLDSAAGQALRG